MFTPPTLVVYYMLAGHSQQLQVMRNETMVWAAQLPHVPVAMTTANFRYSMGNGNMNDDCSFVFIVC